MYQYHDDEVQYWEDQAGTPLEITYSLIFWLGLAVTGALLFG